LLRNNPQLAVGVLKEAPLHRAIGAV
jgi:hypothetical protein